MKTNLTFKRLLTLVLAVMMMVTAMPVGLLAEAQEPDVNYDVNPIKGNEHINSEKIDVKPAKPGDGKKAGDLVKDPDLPEIYTLHTDYLTEKGEKYVISYQPYVASVGADATQEEKDKINKTIDLPNLAGYIKPQDSFTDKYADIVNEAKQGKKKDEKYTNYREFKYDAESKTIKVKHLFQDLEDFAKYTNLDGSTDEANARYSTQSGNTGSTMQIKPLDEIDRKGFVPEAEYISMQVPEDTSKFIVEYRYNRAHYNVSYDTTGGTAIPNRALYYEQVIPKLSDHDIPTKIGCEFLGWKPSVKLTTKDGKTFKANEIIKVATGGAIKNLAADLIMPYQDVKFTAEWKEKEKANYAIQFWVEKADHAEGASLLDKYEYMGTRVYEDVDTGTRPDLDAEKPGPVEVEVKGKKKTLPGLNFPDLDQARLNKIWVGEKFYGDQFLYLNKFFVYNKDLTGKENADPENARLVKKVEATGKTVYNIYYDRQVYELYFTKSNALEEKDTFYPSIYVPDGNGGAKLAGGPGNLYHYKARFNEMMYKWPNDAMQTKGFTPGWQTFGWGPNYAYPTWPLHLDTPPYRLNADEFLDMPNYDNLGGYVSQIDDGAGGHITAKDYRTLSFGIKQQKNSIPHHMDFWMDGFKKNPDWDGQDKTEEYQKIIAYDLVRSKADTDGLTYGHRYPKLLGFTPYAQTIEEGSQEHGRVNEDELNDINDEREEITPFPNKKYIDMYGNELTVGQMKFITAFFSNADEFGDPALDENDKPIVPAFKTNGYLRFKYKRNTYPLRFNYDPAAIKGDNEFNSTNQLDTYFQFPLKALSPDVDDKDEYKKAGTKEGIKNLIDNPENLQKLGLTELIFTDKDGKLKVKRPEGLSDQMEFKGWALDPAGSKLIWENENEIMPTHPVHLFAKWGEPDYKWKVTFDPNGGKLNPINEENITTERKTIQEGDIGQEEKKTYAKKEDNEGDKQIFTVIQRQKLKEPKAPTRKGYDFMGWELIRYKKDNSGNFTDEQDLSYRETYKVPELYTFGNDVVSPLYLRAIWVPNQKVDVEVEHYFLNEDFKLDNTLRENPIKEVLSEKRLNYYVATTADKQDKDWLIAPHEELEAKLKDYTDAAGVKHELRTIYDEYNNNHGLKNSYFQTFRLEPEKIVDTDATAKQGKTVYMPNPKYKEHVFKFFYRPFRKRVYKVNYVDERAKEELATATTNEEKKAIIEKYSIIDKETVKNGNRYYDARNYRHISGWTLADKPQQQLFFDVDENTNALLGINGTGSDEITFYYKDIRVIETKKDDPVPDGYLRVTFKADKGGSFGKDKDGNDIKELYYDVIKGLYSDYLPVPQEWVGGNDAEGKPKAKDKDKYYITPDDGRSFIKWDEKPLLNKKTVLDNKTKDFYVFTAKFDWSGLSASGLVTTESFKDPKGTWTNDFAPTIAKLKEKLVWREKEKVKPIPEGTEIKFFDEAGKELKSDEDVFKLVNEREAADKDELLRTVNIKVTAKFKDEKDTQELNIPIIVYKNVYEALNKDGDKPLFLSEAEKKDAKDGGLKDVTGNYIKVTVAPTGDMNAKDNKVYYVNPKAWVEIPEVKPDGSSTFINWTADIAKQNDDGKANGNFDFAKRHKFTEETVIKPVGANDVVEQTDPTKKPDVPKTYVKVIVKTTDKATDETAFEKTFWVNPSKEVRINVVNPTGKTVAADPANVGALGYTLKFSKWETEDKAKTWDDKIVGQFEKETTILAKYSVDFEKIRDQVPTSDKVHTAVGKIPTADELKEKITPPAGKTISKVTIVTNPDVSKAGDSIAKVIVEYTDGSSAGTNDNPIEVPVEVHESIIPEVIPGQRPEKALDNYVKVILKAGEGGKLEGTLTNSFTYYISPDVEVNLTEIASKIKKTPDTGYIVNGEKWTNKDNKALKGTFTEKETVFEFAFEKSTDIVEKTDASVKIPDGYVTVTFRAEENGAKGKLEGDKVEKIYYVNPKAGIKLKVLADGQTVGEKELAVPKTVPEKNYTFANWYEDIDQTNAITSDRIHVAKFTSAKVSLSYEKGFNDGEGTGAAPSTIFVDHGIEVRLASPKGLSKTDASFDGWKLDGEDKLYKPGDLVKLEKARTATAQWTTDEPIIEYTEENPKTKPEGYVRVSFVAENGLGLTDVKYYYVKANKGITLADTKLVKPTVTPEIGYKFDKWDQDDTTTITDHDIVVTAKATSIPDYVEKTSANPNKPDDRYVTVTFKADNSGNGTVTEKTYYVNPTKYVHLTPPSDAKGETGYEFATWTSEDADFNTANFRIYTKDTTIIAKFNQKDSVVPIKGTETKQPEGYVKVTFEIEGTGGIILNDQVTSYYVDPEREVNLRAPIRASFIGYDFDKWYTKDGNPQVKSEIFPANGNKYKKDTTIYGSFKILEGIIPRKNNAGVDNEKPYGYVTVTFLKGEHGNKIGGETVYYVNPEANPKKKLSEITDTNDARKPTVTPDTGYVFKGWDTADTEITKDMIITATYDELPHAVEKTNQNPNKPDPKYVTVTFRAEDGAKGEIKEKVYFVNPQKYVTLNPPAESDITPNSGYEFSTWSKDVSNYTIYKEDTVITGCFRPKQSVYPKGQPYNDPPSGFVTVTFELEKVDGNDAAEIRQNEVVTYFVKKDTDVTLDPPSMDIKTGYKFEGWDKDATKPNKYSVDTTIIKAKFTKHPDVISAKNDDGTVNAKPEGYVIVNFLGGEHGVIYGKTTFYVNPDANKTIGELSAPKVDPAHAYKFKEWDKASDIVIKTKMNITAKYDKQANIIPQSEEQKTAPEGYVVVIFKTDNNGKLEGDKDQLVYFVNPLENIKLVDDANQTGLKVPATSPNKNYEFDTWFDKIDYENPITVGRVYVAKFKTKEVTLTYVADDADDKTLLPKPAKVSYDTSVRLANQGKLTKKDAKFIGWEIDGHTYAVGEEITLTKDTKAIAQWENDKDIIKYDPENPITKPNGYVRVIFKSDDGLSLSNLNYYYVKADKGLRLADIKNDEVNYGYPGVSASTGYKFDKWDKGDDTVITGDITVTAKPTKLATVIPEKKEDGTPNEKPDSYKEVTFVIKNGDESKGSLEGVTKFYVNPNEYVTINNLPATKAKTGFEFGGWDKNATVPTVYDKDTTITGSFNGLKDAIPKTKDNDSEKPADYVTVKFEIAGEGGSIVKGDTTTYYVDPTKNDVTLQAPGTLANTGYVFDKWIIKPDAATEKEIKPGDPNNYSKETTIYGKFKKLEDIIPETKDDGTPNAKPDGYVTVTFISGANGKLEEKDKPIAKKIYYVNPKSKTKLGALAKPDVEPDVVPDTGFDVADYKWDMLGATNYKPELIIDKDITLIAKYKPLPDVLEKTKEDGTDKPKDYITVKFSTETNGKISRTNNTEKEVYINPNKQPIVLRGQEPDVTANTGYLFTGWDKNINTAISYSDGDTIKAQYTERENIFTAEKPGYVKVEFKSGNSGKLEGLTELWIKPGVEVTIPAPKVNPNVGYKFDKWDKTLTVKAKENDPTYEITAQYKPLGDVIPQGNPDGSDKPNGYVTVTFKAVNGTLSGNTVYYVNGEKEVDLTNTADNIAKKADLGYTADGGTWDKALKAKFKDGDVITFTFEALPAVIEKIDENTKQPDGYVTVKLIPTDNATDSKKIIYYVNPKENVSIPSTDPIGKKITDRNDNTYTFLFKEWAVTRGTITPSWEKGEKIVGTFTQDTDITAKYNVEIENIIQGPIPKENVVTAKGDVPEAKDLIKNIPGSAKDPLPSGTTINYKDNKNPDLSTPGKTDVEVEVHYPNGKISIVTVPILVVENVVEQKANVKPPVPDDYIMVTVDPTAAATDNTNYKKIFWVKPNTQVKLDGIYDPIGKDIEKDGVTKPNKFVKWTLEGSDPVVEYKVVDNSITASFEKESRIIANYENVENIKPVGKDNLWLPLNSKQPEAKDFIENVYDDNNPDAVGKLPPGTKFAFKEGTEPNTKTIGPKETTIVVTYPNGEVVKVPVEYTVTGDVVEQRHGDDKPAVPENFVLVIVSTKEAPEETQAQPGQTPDGVEKADKDSKFERRFWVDPTKDVIIPVEGKKIVGIKDADHRQWKFDHWQGVTIDKTNYGEDEIKGRFLADTTYIFAKYRKDDIPTPDADYVVTEVGVLPKPEDYEKFITGPQKIISTTILEDPDVSKPGRTKALLEVEYKDGTKTKVYVKVYVQERQDRYYPEVIYRDRIVEKEKIVEKIVKIKDDERLKEIRYMQGFNGKFRPNDGLRRAEAAQILANALKADGYVYDAYYPISYSDVGNTWYTEAVRIVSQAGVFQGYSDGTFKPEGKITRAEWIATLRRFQNLRKANGNDMGLSMGHWATEEVEAAYQAGWLDVYTSGIASFDYNKPITRQEVAAISNKAFERVLDKVYLKRNVKNMINYTDINPSMPLFEDILCASNTLLTDGRYYKANTIVMDNVTFNIVTDEYKIYQKRFQFDISK